MTASKGPARGRGRRYAFLPDGSLTPECATQVDACSRLRSSTVRGRGAGQPLTGQRLLDEQVSAIVTYHTASPVPPSWLVAALADRWPQWQGDFGRLVRRSAQHLAAHGRIDALGSTWDRAYRKAGRAHGTYPLTPSDPYAENLPDSVPDRLSDIPDGVPARALNVVEGKGPTPDGGTDYVLPAADEDTSGQVHPQGAPGGSNPSPAVSAAEQRLREAERRFEAAKAKPADDGADLFGLCS